VETAAALVRMSESHVRFGTFEVFYYRRQPERIRELADYVIAHNFPELAGAEDRYRQFLLAVAGRTARLIAKWQAVGFAHGVMNTDNMSILGVTLDYGPFGFLDDYHAGFICNHSDHSGRYAFDQQPAVGLWNVSRLAQALVNLITVEEATAALDVYQPAFAAHYGELMRAKLGLKTEAETDAGLLLDLLGLLEANGVDYTNFFRRLANFQTAGDAPRQEQLRDMFVEPAAFDAWAARYRARLLAEASVDAERKRRMDEVNPKYVLRNYLAQNAIDAATERRDYTEIERLREVLDAPFAEQPGREGYAESPPDWGKRLAVSCSS
jgi:uncharacterized protein YdiU (UPF0061 family)